MLRQAASGGNALTLPAARHHRTEPAKSFPVQWVACARVVAELAGFSVEVSYAGA